VKQEIANAKCIREDPLEQDSGLIPKATVAKEKKKKYVGSGEHYENKTAFLKKQTKKNLLAILVLYSKFNRVIILSAVFRLQ